MSFFVAIYSNMRIVKTVNQIYEDEIFSAKVYL